MLSPTTRLKHPRPLRKKHIWRALIVERPLFVPHENYQISCSPLFWGKVFVRVYGTAPVSDNDPRYDPLFKTGFKLLAKLLEE